MKFYNYMKSLSQRIEAMAHWTVLLATNWSKRLATVCDFVSAKAVLFLGQATVMCWASTLPYSAHLIELICDSRDE